MIGTRKTRTDADAVYVAIESFSVKGDAGEPLIVRRGARLRGNHPAVARVPQFFVLDPGSDDEAITRDIAVARRAVGFKS
jgi:hypothetical protein